MELRKTRSLKVAILVSALACSGNAIGVLADDTESDSQKRSVKGSEPPRIFRSATAEGVSMEVDSPRARSESASSGTLAVLPWLAGTLLLSLLTIPRKSNPDSA